MSEVVIKASAFSNITYHYEYPTGYTPEEWAELTDKEKDDVYSEAVWSDLDAWHEVID